MSQLTSNTSQTLGLAMNLLQAAYVSQALSAKKGQEGGLSIVGCHFYVILKVSCGFREGEHCSSQMTAGGSWVRLPAVSWNGKDLREVARLPCSEGVILPEREREIVKWSGPQELLEAWTQDSSQPLSFCLTVYTVGLGGVPIPLTHHSLDGPMRTCCVPCRSWSLCTLPCALRISGHCAHLNCDRHGVGDSESLGEKSRQEEVTCQLHGSCCCPQAPPSVTWPLLSRGQPWTSSCLWAY